VLLDAAGWRGVQCLAKGQPITADDLSAIARAQGTEVRPWDVALIRTGYLSYWPDEQKMRDHLTPGPDLSAAQWLLDRGVVATGTDTETYEVQPPPHQQPGEPSNPQPVHTKLLIEHGIYLMESIYLEELARDKVREFLFVAAPLKIAGATGSMIDPLAVI
jgi:kynurenine formamidase